MKKTGVLILVLVLVVVIVTMGTTIYHLNQPVINFAVQPFSEPKNDAEVLTNLVYRHGNVPVGKQDYKTLNIGDYVVSIGFDIDVFGESRDRPFKKKPCLYIKYYKDDTTESKYENLEYSDYSLDGALDCYTRGHNTYLRTKIGNEDCILNIFPCLDVWYKSVDERHDKEPQKKYEETLKMVISLVKHKYE